MMYAIIVANLLAFAVGPSAERDRVEGAPTRASRAWRWASLSSLGSLMAVIAPMLGAPLLAEVSHLPAGRLAHRRPVLPVGGTAGGRPAFSPWSTSVATVPCRTSRIDAPLGDRRRASHYHSPFAADLRRPGRGALRDTDEMTILETRLNARSAEFRGNAEAMRALVADLKEKVNAVGEGGGAGSARQAHAPAASCCRATACRCCSTPARPSSNCRSSRPTACTTTRRRRPGSSPASAASPGASA